MKHELEEYQNVYLLLLIMSEFHHTVEILLGFFFFFNAHIQGVEMYFHEAVFLYNRKNGSNLSERRMLRKHEKSRKSQVIANTAFTYSFSQVIENIRSFL